MNKIFQLFYKLRCQIWIFSFFDFVAIMFWFIDQNLRFSIIHRLIGTAYAYLS